MMTASDEEAAASVTVSLLTDNNNNNNNNRNTPSYQMKTEYGKGLKATDFQGREELKPPNAFHGREDLKPPSAQFVASIFGACIFLTGVVFLIVYKSAPLDIFLNLGLFFLAIGFVLLLIMAKYLVRLYDVYHHYHRNMVLTGVFMEFIVATIYISLCSVPKGNPNAQKRLTAASDVMIFLIVLFGVLILMGIKYVIWLIGRACGYLDGDSEY